MEIYSDSLAKLFAAENIGVEIKKTSTAYFDVKNRKMTFPTWILELPVASRELLMLHEASHALHTPEFGTHEKAKEYEQVFRTILNVLEDKRIEDMMKEKFPGAKATFIRGFFELVNKNFFGIRFHDSTEDLSLIDRMNLHFKGDYYFECEFTKEEQYWVDRAAQNKTFEEVYQNALELFEWIKKEYSKEVLENIKYNLDDLQFSNSEYDDDGNQFQRMELDKVKEAIGEEAFEELMNAIDENRNKDAEDIINQNLKDDRLNFSENNAAKTDQNWEKNQENFMKDKNNEYNSFTYRHPLNLNLPRRLNSDDFIVKNTDITKVLTENFSYMADEEKENFQNFMKKHKDSMRQILSHMVREFYRKKAAEDYRRTQESKTGNLDLGKLPHYKYNSDLFLNKSVIKDEKNHGFVLLLDWSGSMSTIMTNAILQLINNVAFCKAIDVPFVAYAFSSEAGKSYDNPQTFVVHATDENDLRIGYSYKLLELCDSTKKNYEEQLRNLYYLAYCFINNNMVPVHRYKSMKRACDEYLRQKHGDGPMDTLSRADWRVRQLENIVVLSDLFELGSTPLNDSLVLMNHVLPKTQQRMGVDIMNFITITDGDSDYIQSPAGITDTKTYRQASNPNKNSETYQNDSAQISNLFSIFGRNGAATSRYHNEGAFFLRSLYSNRVYNLTLPEMKDGGYGHSKSRERTRTFAKVLKEETGANVISIELLSNNNTSFKKSIISMYNTDDFEKIEKISADYRKNGFAIIENGYDKIFAVNTNVICEESYNRHYYYDVNSIEIEERDYFDDVAQTKDGKYTTKQLKNALVKNSSQKAKRKFLASRIVDIISDKQKISA